MQGSASVKPAAASPRKKNCGRPFFRRILSSLHRKPERRKRNAHCTAFRQSLHCLIAERCQEMHLGFLFERHFRMVIDR